MVYFNKKERIIIHRHLMGDSTALIANQHNWSISDVQAAIGKYYANKEFYREKRT